MKKPQTNFVGLVWGDIKWSTASFRSFVRQVHIYRVIYRVTESHKRVDVLHVPRRAVRVRKRLSSVNVTKVFHYPPITSQRFQNPGKRKMTSEQLSKRVPRHGTHE